MVAGLAGVAGVAGVGGLLAGLLWAIRLLGNISERFAASLSV